MKRLVLDFLRRYRWFLAFLGGTTLVSTAVGFPFCLSNIAVAMLAIDQKSGVLRATRLLPLSQREQSRTWWAIGVLLLPILYLVPLAAGALFYHSTHPASEAPPTFSGWPPFIESGLAINLWLAAAVQTWVGLGGAAFSFLLISGLPSGRGAGGERTEEQSFTEGLWGLTIPGMVLLQLCLPRQWASVAPWHWILFATVPVWLVLSFRTAPGMTERRAFLTRATAKAGRSRSEDRGRLQGLPLFFATFVGRSVLAVSLMFVVQWLCLFLLIGHATSTFVPSVCAAFGGMFSILICSALGLRMLRTLPLSTAQLTALLLTIPLAAGGVTGILAVVLGNESPSLPLGTLTALAMGAATSGAGALALAVALRATGNGQLIAMMALLVPGAIVTSFVKGWPLQVMAAGAIAFVAATALLHRSLRRSSSVYRPSGLSALSPTPQIGS